ncbi:MAG: sucrase ferredoxin [bacterium]|nr:sucrase ferredoxin [bacterium]
MTIDAFLAPAKSYCNCLAQERGLDPVGHAGHFEDAVLVETPLPWKREMNQQAGTHPQKMIDLLALWLEQYYAGRGYPHLLLAIAPDPDYSREGFRRVMFYTRPEGLFAQFSQLEYLVPEAEVGALVWTYYQERQALPSFDRYRVPASKNVRDILVCTHGTVDAACAKFGYPLYRHLRDIYASERLRVWRVSHFGGHVFAPTMMDMPTGHYWAYVGEEQAARIVTRQGDVGALRGHYRGWAGLGDGFQQAAECALWQRYGWTWFDIPKSGATLGQDAPEHAPEKAVVRMTYLPAGSTLPVEADFQVAISQHLETPHSTAAAQPYAYPQYRVVESAPASGD